MMYPLKSEKFRGLLQLGPKVSSDSKDSSGDFLKDSSKDSKGFLKACGSRGLGVPVTGAGRGLFGDWEGALAPPQSP